MLLQYDSPSVDLGKYLDLSYHVINNMGLSVSCFMLASADGSWIN